MAISLMAKVFSVKYLPWASPITQQELELEMSSQLSRANAHGAGAEIGPSTCGHWLTGRLCVSQNGNAEKDAGSH